MLVALRGDNSNFEKNEVAYSDSLLTSAWLGREKGGLSTPAAMLGTPASLGLLSELVSS